MGINTQLLSVVGNWLDDDNSLGRTLTLGRLSLTTLRFQSADDLRAQLKGLVPAGLDVGNVENGDDVLHALGATEVASLDMSDYQGAVILHDLNEPLSPEFHASWDTVINGGTLEHVFNFPQAIKTSMELCREGGHLICLSPMNNQPGHGFYQFSPELFFRVLSEENGFEIDRVIAYEKFPGGHRYQVTDPAEAGRRVGVINSHIVDLVVIAKRVRVVDVLKKFPQQSDYSANWSASDGPNLRRARETSLPLRVVRAATQLARQSAPAFEHHLQGWIDRARRGRSKSFRGQPSLFRRK